MRDVRLWIGSWSQSCQHHVANSDVRVLRASPGAASECTAVLLMRVFVFVVPYGCAAVVLTFRWCIDTVAESDDH